MSATNSLATLATAKPGVVDDSKNVASTEQVVDAPISLGDSLPNSIADLLPDSARPYWDLVQQYPLLEGLIILGVFWIAAYLIRRYAIKLVQQLAGKTETELDDKIIEELRAPIFSTVIWIGVMIAAATAGFNNGWWRFITPVIASIIVLIWLRVGLSLSSLVFTAMARDTKHFKKIDIRTEPLLIIASKIIALLVGSYVILLIWGINPVGLLASAGIVGIAVGFAAKDTLANLFSGVFILADRPYKLGDYVNLDGGERGKVTQIGIRSTRILTRDDIEITIPNGLIGNAMVINESGGPSQRSRIRFSLQCAYQADLEAVCELLMKIANDEELICQYPNPRVRVRGFAENGISLQLLAWINLPEDRGRIKHIVYMKIHSGFKQHGFEIPYPKRDITITKLN